MAHYYAHHARPLHAHAFGLIDRWARIASHMPSIANFLTGAPPFATLAKRLAHIDDRRRITPFADRSFTAWFRSRPARGAGRKVILWPDTFSNYFHPEIARAAVEVLEHAGCAVEIPRMHLCCGRPLYEFGMLDRARAYLQRMLDALDADIRAGTPIVGLEPACVSVFRDELPNLFPYDEQARRLSRQVVLLSEFLLREDLAYPVPQLQGKALVHGHCHHKAVLKMDAELELLRRMGLDVDTPDSGCCGMAGSFGFNRDKYAVSIACGERVLLPAVRAAAADTLVLADGFSCREQIEQTTGRHALHLAQALRMGMGVTE
jgi:Fe-S oxidoreductase